jgi:hypothetical protein
MKVKSEMEPEAKSKTNSIQIFTPVVCTREY